MFVEVYLENRLAGAFKFWRSSVTKVSQGWYEVRTSWGRIGTTGQSKLESYASETVARNQHEIAVRKKLQRGYSRVVAAQSPGRDSTREPPIQNIPSRPATDESPRRKPEPVKTETPQYAVGRRRLILIDDQD